MQGIAIQFRSTACPQPPPPVPPLLTGQFSSGPVVAIQAGTKTKLNRPSSHLMRHTCSIVEAGSLQIADGRCCSLCIRHELWWGGSWCVGREGYWGGGVPLVLGMPLGCPPPPRRNSGLSPAVHSLALAASRCSPPAQPEGRADGAGSPHPFDLGPQKCAGSRRSTPPRTHKPCASPGLAGQHSARFGPQASSGVFPGAWPQCVARVAAGPTVCTRGSRASVRGPCTCNDAEWPAIPMRPRGRCMRCTTSCATTARRHWPLPMQTQRPKSDPSRICHQTNKSHAPPVNALPVACVGLEGLRLPQRV